MNDSFQRNEFDHLCQEVSSRKPEMAEAVENLRNLVTISDDNPFVIKAVSKLLKDAVNSDKYAPEDLKKMAEKLDSFSAQHKIARPSFGPLHFLFVMAGIALMAWLIYTTLQTG